MACVFVFIGALRTRMLSYSYESPCVVFVHLHACVCLSVLAFCAYDRMDVYVLMRV